jgi:type I restriction enzyme S subunit
MVGTWGRQRLSADGAGKYSVSIPNPDEMESLNELSAHLLWVVNARVVENRSLARTRDELLPLLMPGNITVRAAEQIVGEVT